MSQKKSPAAIEKRDRFLVICWGIAVIWFIWLGLAYVCSDGIKEGQFASIGDSFGALNALISMLGFAAILYTIQTEHESGEDERERHKEIQILQTEILHSQQQAAQAQQLHAEVATLAANIQTQTTIIESTAAENDRNQDFMKKYGDLIINLIASPRSISLKEVLESTLEQQQLEEFRYACGRIAGYINMEADAAKMSKAILVTWEELATSLNRQHNIARELKNLYISRLVGEDDEVRAIIKKHLQA